MGGCLWAVWVVRCRLVVWERIVVRRQQNVHAHLHILDISTWECKHAPCAGASVWARLYICGCHFLPQVCVFQARKTLCSAQHQHRRQWRRHTAGGAGCWCTGIRFAAAVQSVRSGGSDCCGHCPVLTLRYSSTMSRWQGKNSTSCASTMMTTSSGGTVLSHLPPGSNTLVTKVWENYEGCQPHGHTRIHTSRARANQRQTGRSVQQGQQIVRHVFCVVS